MKIKKGDHVLVVAGKDKGATGTVIAAYPDTQRVLVQGVNMVKKNKKVTNRAVTGTGTKEGGITTLTRFFPKIAKAYLIGEATDEFAKTLEGQVTYERCGTLDVATAKAAADAAASSAKEPVVLLSPACASFDQYRNFEIRGDHFRKLVKQLIG